MPLVTTRLSTHELRFNARGEAGFTIANSGLFRLYWAADIEAPTTEARARFDIRPDYGVIARDGEQQVTVRLLPATPDLPAAEKPRALLEIASNDARNPRIEILFHHQERE